MREAEAKQSDCVLVLEPGTGLTGKLKAARKGVGKLYDLNRRGSGPCGVDFSNGASAIVEAARQVEKIAAFTDLKRGTTVNPGVISGGTRTNVIAAHARIVIDIRAVRLKHAEALDKKFRALRPIDKRCKLQIEAGVDGLGGVGEGAHAVNESILVDRIADRTALLAGLLAEL